MRRRYIGTILAGLAFAAWACRGDPTAELRSGPATLSLSINFGALEVGKKGPVLVVARDAQLNPIPLDPINATSADQTIATVAADTSRHFADGATHPFLITGVAAGTTTVTFTGGALKDSVVVTVQ